MELQIPSLNNLILVGSAIFYLILQQSCGLIRRYIAPCFLPKTLHLPPTKYKIRPFVIRQNGANIHSLVHISLWHPVTNLYTSVVDFVKFFRLVEEALDREFYVLTFIDFDIQMLPVTVSY